MSEISLHKLYSDEPEFGDFFSLLKPRVMSLVVFTAIAGLLAAPGNIHPFVAFVSIVFIALGGGASGALNMWYDADIDSIMSRTKSRPVPAGKISANDAKYIGIVLSAISVVMLGLASNWLAAFLLAFTIFFYVIVYTIWLKRATPQNIVIGGAAGAMPPVLGWSAVTGEVGSDALLLFLIIFCWTPPHFWALALYRREEYAAAGIPMLPVTHGQQHTLLQMVLYTILLLAVSVLPFATGMSGMMYFAGALILGTIFLVFVVRLYRNYSDALSKQTFGYSIQYLAMLFALMLIDHYQVPLREFIFSPFI